jgi:hypothetical protein
VKLLNAKARSEKPNESFPKCLSDARDINAESKVARYTQQFPMEEREIDKQRVCSRSMRSLCHSWCPSPG